VVCPCRHQTEAVAALTSRRRLDTYREHALSPSAPVRYGLGRDCKLSTRKQEKCENVCFLSCSPGRCTRYRPLRDRVRQAGTAIGDAGTACCRSENRRDLTSSRPAGRRLALAPCTNIIDRPATRKRRRVQGCGGIEWRAEPSPGHRFRAGPLPAVRERERRAAASPLSAPRERWPNGVPWGTARGAGGVGRCCGSEAG